MATAGHYGLRRIGDNPGYSGPSVIEDNPESSANTPARAPETKA